MTPEERAILHEVVTIDPEILHGTPCLTGTRVPVQTLLDYLESGATMEEFLQDFGRVKREQAVAFLELAKQRLIECASS